jgi:DNA-binding transcriptional ArsR family regulator
MAFSKQHLYRPETQLASATFKTLSYSGRLEILFKLYAEGPLCVQDLAKGHPICLETISGHLRILRMAGLIIAEERFPYTFYSIDEKNIDKAEEILINFFAQLKGTKN